MQGDRLDPLRLAKEFGGSGRVAGLDPPKKSGKYLFSSLKAAAD